MEKFESILQARINNVQAGFNGYTKLDQFYKGTTDPDLLLQKTDFLRLINFALGCFLTQNTATGFLRVS